MRDAPSRLKPNWRTYSIRSLAFVIAALAVILGWIAKEREQSRRQVEMAGALVSRGVSVSFYDDVQSGWLAWKADVLGRRVEQVSISGDDAVDCFKQLAVFQDLKLLSIDSDEIRDLTPLTSLRKLEALSVYRADVDDLTPLGELTQLNSLVLYRTNAHDLRPLASLSRLTHLDLGRSPIEDLTPLHSVRSLQLLRLVHTPVTEEETASLKRALPNCEVRESK